MSVDDFNLLSQDDVAEDGEEGEDGRERRPAVHHQERDMVHFQAIRQVPYSCAAWIGVGDDDDLVAAVDEFLSLRSATDDE